MSEPSREYQALLDHLRVEVFRSSPRVPYPIHDTGWRIFPETILVWVESGPYCCHVQEGPVLRMTDGQAVLVPLGYRHRFIQEAPCQLAWFHARFSIFACQDPLSHIPHPVRLEAETATPIADLLDQTGINTAQSFTGLLRRQGQIMHILAALLDRFPRPEPKDADLARERLAPVMRYLAEHLASVPRRDHLARMAGLSPARFHALFRTATGTTPLAYLHAERIRLAMKNLGHSDAPLADLAKQLGYCDEFHFSRRFKDETGLSPQAFRLHARRVLDHP